MGKSTFKAHLIKNKYGDINLMTEISTPDRNTNQLFSIPVKEGVHNLCLIITKSNLQISLDEGSKIEVFQHPHNTNLSCGLIYGPNISSSKKIVLETDYK